MEQEVTRVKILGVEYKISCPPSESEQVKRAAQFFDKKIKEIRQNSNTDENKSAIVAGLNITNEFLNKSSSFEGETNIKDNIKRLSFEVEKHLKTLSKF